MTDLQEYFVVCSRRVEEWLDKKLAPYNKFSDGLTEGMRYSVFAGGKRLRPVLMFASFGVFSEDADIVTPFAASLEMLHTYSLIHDDLPAMDNDDLRRGVPTNHKKFGEAEAILAGDALLTKAFEFMADPSNSPKLSDNIRLKAIRALAAAAGDRGMVAGQFADVKAEKSSAQGPLVKFIHANKTGALITYAVTAGALLAGKSGDDVENMTAFGENIGMAFQIADDLLDIASTAEELGKSPGKDAASGKATYPRVYGADESAKMAKELTDKAVESLAPYGPRAEVLKSVALFITERNS